MDLNLVSAALSKGDPNFSAKLLIAAVPIGGALGAALTSLWSAGRTTYVNTITAERTKALGELRHDLAEFSTALSTLAFDRALRTEAARKAGKGEAILPIEQIVAPFEKLERMENMIRLRLNPDRQVDRIVTILMTECGIKMVDDINMTTKMNRLFCLHSQWLIKEEWSSIKREAGGLMYKVANSLGAIRQARAYQKFLQGEGEITISLSMALVKHYTRQQGLDWGTDDEYEAMEKRLKPNTKQGWWKRTVAKARERQILRRLAVTAPPETAETTGNTPG